MKRLMMMVFVLLALMSVSELAAQQQLDWDLVILSVNGSMIQMRLDVVNNTDQAWSHTFGYSNIALYSIDGWIVAGVWLPIVVPYTLEPGQSDSFDMYHYEPLAPGVHVIQAHLNIPVGDSYLAVGQPETVTFGDTEPLQVGDGSEPARVPIDFYWRTSLYQCVYTAADLAHQPAIVTGLSFFNAFGEDPYNNFLYQNIKLFLSPSPLSNLEGGWINGNQQILQFDGQADFPAGNNEIHFNLLDPIELDGYTGLLLTVFRPIHSSYQYTADPFLADECPAGRALRYYSDALEHSPYQPPTFIPDHLFNRLPMTVFNIIPTGDPVEVDDPQIPVTPLRISVFPNPYNQSCELRLDDAPKASGTIRIYDLRGRRLRELSVNGSDSVPWDGRNSDGNICPNGIYLYRASFGSQQTGGKIIRLGR